MWTSLFEISLEFEFEFQCFLKSIKSDDFNPIPTTTTCQIIVQQISLFFGGKNTYSTLLGPRRLYFLRFFLQNLIFAYINEKKIHPTL